MIMRQKIEIEEAKRNYDIQNAICEEIHEEYTMDRTKREIEEYDEELRKSEYRDAEVRRLFPDSEIVTVNNHAIAMDNIRNDPGYLKRWESGEIQ